MILLTDGEDQGSQLQDHGRHRSRAEIRLPSVYVLLIADRGFYGGFGGYSGDSRDEEAHRAKPAAA